MTLKMAEREKEKGKYMSLAYCYNCLERYDEENEDCTRHGDELVYGENRTAYLRGYRDAKEGKDEDS